MAPKNGKTAPGHDDVSGLFARLGTQASEGYYDFAHTQLPPRKPGVTESVAPAAVAPVAVAPETVHPSALVPVSIPTANMPAAVQQSVAERWPQPLDAAVGHAPDALAPLRKLRQLDEPAPRGVQPADRPAHTPLERLFQRLLQADARSSAQSPLKRLRSR